jgi:peroxiredoxin
MKKIILLLTLFSVCFSCGQRGQEKAPEHVIIANGEIITMEQLLEYQKEDHIKAIHDGVSDEKREQLFEIFGNKIPPKKFIIYIELFSEEEKLERDEIKHKAEDLKRRYEEFIASFVRDGRLSPVRHFLNVNDTAKDFSVQMITGETITLSELRGQVVLLYFWTTTCGPCIRQFHDFPSKIIEPFKNSPFVLLPISAGEPIERVKNKMAQLKERGVDFNVGIDPDRSIFHLYANGGVPHTFLIDKNGVISDASYGAGPSELLDNMIFMIERMLIASTIEKIVERINP